MKVAIFGTESYDCEFLTAANADVRIESHGSRARRWRGLPRLVRPTGRRWPQGLTESILPIQSTLIAESNREHGL